MRTIIRNLIQSVDPWDDVEREHIADALAWIDSGAEIFRVHKPATPPKHVVSFFVVVDPKQKKILLLDHIKSGRMLPSGGHVEPHEHPKTTVEREIVEELNQTANFVRDDPVFITQIVTVGQAAGHTDVDLWYVLTGDAEKPIEYDPGEFTGYHWLGYDEILASDIQKFDPHMHRFVHKLLASHVV